MTADNSSQAGIINLFEQDGWRIVSKQTERKWKNPSSLYTTMTFSESYTVLTLECKHEITFSKKPETVLKNFVYCPDCGKPSEKLVNTFNLL